MSFDNVYTCMKLLANCDGGVMVSIVAFQAVDPGSIPGHRRIIFARINIFFII